MMLNGIWPRWRWVVIGLIAGVCLATTVIRSTVAAAIRNEAHLELGRYLLGHPDACTQIPPRVIQCLEIALQLDPEVDSSWRTLVRLKGLTDRQWIVDRASGIDAVAVSRAADEWLPASKMSATWSKYRCRSVWSLWTIALVQAEQGNLERAVAAYQAGLGLAPGRVPDDILREYYLALGHYQLTGQESSPARQLAAAKYLALAGATDEASRLFAPLAQSDGLTWQQRCDARRGLIWLQSGEAGTPPWPATQTEREACGEGRAEQPASPEWTLKPNPPVVNSSGATLTGFDLDHDVLDAGVEVIGVLYRKRSDGQTVAQRFRQPDLWPNSGNTWLSLDSFTTCLPGYAEPVWVSPCAGQMVMSDSIGVQSPVGRVVSPHGQYADRSPDQIPDAFITTATFPVSKNRFVVYGGWWKKEGNLPWPHLAQQYASGNPPLVEAPYYYAAVIDLTAMPVGVWQAHAAVSKPLAFDYDYFGWIRPRAGKGEGALEFDDVFAFSLSREGIRTTGIRILPFQDKR